MKFNITKCTLSIIGSLAIGCFNDVNATTPLVCQHFTQPTPWAHNIDSTGIWRIAGTWIGSGSNTLMPSLAATAPSYPADSGTGYLALSMNPGPALQGSEIQSLPTTGYSYGYYETRMEVTTGSGGCASFFVVEAPHYGPHEIDIEFLLNESWLTSASTGAVHYTLHGPSGSRSQKISLPFNPTLGFHRYGILWQPGTVSWYVDGALSCTVNDSDFTTTAQMYMMANMWSGDPKWGGGPPSEVSTSYYDWIKFWPNVTSPPDSNSPWP